MPADRFYLSVAPYLDTTHDCHFHSLTSCRGELSRAEVEVTVRYDASGDIVLQQRWATHDDGFIGLWLPRHVTGALSIEYQGRHATSAISTSRDDHATCLTTMRLT